MLEIVFAVLIVVYIIVVELRFHELSHKGSEYKMQDFTNSNLYIKTSDPREEKEGFLESKISDLEARFRGQDKKTALEEKGIKEGSIISKRFVKRSLYTNYDYTNFFIITECNWKTLGNDEIVVENSAHESQTIDTWGVGLAEDKDKKEFIQNYNECAEGLKIKESK